MTDQSQKEDSRENESFDYGEKRSGDVRPDWPTVRTRYGAIGDVLQTINEIPGVDTQSEPDIEEAGRQTLVTVTAIVNHDERDELQSESDTDSESEQDPDVEGEWEPEPHPSGVSFIEIRLWTDGEYPGSSDPTETFGGPAHAGDHYALGGDEVGTVEEQMVQFLESHFSGECDCLHD